MRILIALDASPHCERTLDFASRMRWPAGSRLIIVAVASPIVGSLAAPYEPAAAAPGLLEDQRRPLQEAVARAEVLLRETGFATEGRVDVGDPRQVLLEVAQDVRADLIVMGSHGLTGITKLMLGSVSSHVVTHAPCSVLVVKQATGKGKGPPVRKEDKS